MTSKIFRSTVFVAVVVLLCSLGIVMGVLYNHFTGAENFCALTVRALVISPLARTLMIVSPLPSNFFSFRLARSTTSPAWKLLSSTFRLTRA